MRDFYTNPGKSHHRYGGVSVTLEEVQRLRTVPLVPWATGKCPDCGSTLVVDPLGHRCGPEYLKHVTYSETVIP